MSEDMLQMQSVLDDRVVMLLSVDSAGISGYVYVRVPFWMRGIIMSHLHPCQCLKWSVDQLVSSFVSMMYP